MASAADIAPTPCVRPHQMALRVNIVSTSRSVAGNVRTKSRSWSSHPSGTSAIIPPMRATEVVRRAPVQDSCRLYTRSRCSNVHRNGV